MKIWNLSIASLSLIAGCMNPKVPAVNSDKPQREIKWELVKGNVWKLGSLEDMQKTAMKAFRNDSITLHNLIVYASANAPRVMKAYTSLEGARAAVSSQKWAYWPKPSASSEFDPLGGELATDIKLTQPIWSGGTLNARLALVKSQYTELEEEFFKTQLDTAIEVIDVFEELIKARMSKSAWEEAGQEQENLIARLKNQFAKGQVSQTELSSAIKQRNTAAVQEVNFQNSYLEANSKLESVLGTQVSQKTIEPTSPKAVDQNKDKALARAISLSPSINLAKAELVSAKEELRLVKSSRFPTVFASVSQRLGGSTSGNSSGTRFSVGATVDIGPGFSIVANINQAKVNVEVAENNLEIAERDLYGRIERNQITLRTSGKQYLTLQSIYEKSKSHVESVNRSFQAGNSNWEQLMTAYEDHASVQSTFAEVMSAQIASSWRIHILTNTSENW